MAFCTIVEWGSDFDPSHMAALAESVDSQELPDGCLSRLVGRTGSGACVIEVWQTGDDAQRFTEQSLPQASASAMPPPSRVEGFEAESFQTR
jgi:hypothetical protein